MKIMKFGGTSVGSPDAIKKIIAIIKAERRAPAAVVVSAFSGVTDTLIAIARTAAGGDKTYRAELNQLTQRHRLAVEALIGVRARPVVARQAHRLLAELIDVMAGVFLVQETTLRSLDFIMSFGERLSATIVAAALAERGLPAVFFDARAIIKTDASFGAARVDFKVTYPLIRQALQGLSAVPVVTGFIGSAAGGATTTLGRGGSDYTAAIVGAALGVSVIEIWTDVDGVMTADPRKVPGAFVIDELSYAEAMEMSYFGAKVIHPPTMEPALEKGIPLVIKNTFNPRQAGTRIVSKPKPSVFFIRGVTSTNRVALLRVEGSGLKGTPGSAARLFGALARHGINVILISQAASEHSICFAVESDAATAARQALEIEFSLELETGRLSPIVMDLEAAIVAVVGEGVRERPGSSGRLFEALGRARVNVVAIAQGSSELNISVVINRSQERAALKAIHAAFFSPSGEVSVYLVGTGHIGGELLTQIKNLSVVKNRSNTPRIKVVGLLNSQRMLFDEAGVNLAAWPKLLAAATTSAPTEFVERVCTSDIPNRVLVDCTASEEISLWYAKLLGARVGVVTPNKRANTGRLAYYRQLKKIAAEQGVAYRYTSAVGGGLPILPALGRLEAARDQVQALEAVLSGTLSYIFNSFVGNKKFSAVVKAAWAAGYTEPDPREDLSGRDVGRKLLILARELGYAAESKHITIQNLLPPACAQAASVKDFFAILERYDSLFERKKQSAKKSGQRLCYVARLALGRGSVALKAIGQEHPFFGLSGADNIVAITSANYKTTPLVIRGPGAGAAVTAAGILADIMSIHF